MYKDHYFPDATPEQDKLNEFHNRKSKKNQPNRLKHSISHIKYLYSHATDHCLDMLRQSVMCSGDVQLLTMKWMKTVSIPTANFSMPHKCVNWAKLEEWTSSRKIKHLMDQGYLMHPTLGPAYPGGHGDSIGELHEAENL